MFNLTCFVEGLLHNNIDQNIRFIWKRSNGTILANSTELHIQSSNHFSNSVVFNSLLTSHGGSYTCETSGLNLADGRITTSVPLVVNCMSFAVITMTLTLILFLQYLQYLLSGLNLHTLLWFSLVTVHQQTSV